MNYLNIDISKIGNDNICMTFIHASYIDKNLVVLDSGRRVVKDYNPDKLRFLEELHNTYDCPMIVEDERETGRRYFNETSI